MVINKEHLRAEYSTKIPIICNGGIILQCKLIVKGFITSGGIIYFVGEK